MSYDVLEKELRLLPESYLEDVAKYVQFLLYQHEQERMAPLAESDLAEVYSYISTELQSAATADNVIDSLQRAVKDLSIMPNRYHRYMEEPWFSEGVCCFFGSKFFCILHCGRGRTMHLCCSCNLQ